MPNLGVQELLVIFLIVLVSIGSRVEGGLPGTEDHDTGTIVAIDGDQVTVAWDSETIVLVRE